MEISKGPQHILPEVSQSASIVLQVADISLKVDITWNTKAGMCLKLVGQCN